jgi:hypothetical protein
VPHGEADVVGYQDPVRTPVDGQGEISNTPVTQTRLDLVQFIANARENHACYEQRRDKAVWMSVTDKLSSDTVTCVR